MIPNAMSSAASGIQQNLERFSNAAFEISKGEPDQLVAGLVELKISELGVKANSAVIRVADEMYGSLIDVIA